MLVRLVSTLIQLLFSCSLPFLQNLCFSCHSSLVVSILKEMRREEKQVFIIRSGGEVNPVDVVSRRIHFAFQHCSNPHLILQDGLALFTLKHRMTALSCAPLQHQKSVFTRLLQQQFGSLGKSLWFIHIKAESRTWQFHAFHYALRIMPGVIELYQSAFRSIASGTSLTQIRLLLFASTQLLIFLFRGDGTGNLVPVLHLN